MDQQVIASKRELIEILFQELENQKSAVAQIRDSDYQACIGLRDHYMESDALTVDQLQKIKKSAKPRRTTGQVRTLGMFVINTLTDIANELQGSGKGSVGADFYVIRMLKNLELIGAGSVKFQIDAKRLTIEGDGDDPFVDVPPCNVTLKLSSAGLREINRRNSVQKATSR